MATTDITDFNDPAHRVESASAAFQKGIYHLFVLEHYSSVDAYAVVLRSYQCLFELLLTQLLLDDFPIDSDRIPARLRMLCTNPNQPTRRCVDPATLVTHATFEYHKWSGFKAGHPIEKVSQESIKLYDRVVDARHNLLYRPRLLINGRNRWYWEDCVPDTLIGRLPAAKKIEQAYQRFCRAATKWAAQEHAQTKDDLPRATLFFASLARLFIDRRRGRRRPPMTLLPSYTWLLNRGDREVMAGVRGYARRTFPTVRSLLYRDPP